MLSADVALSSVEYARNDKMKTRITHTSSLHHSGVQSTFFTKRKTLGDLREGISLVNESWDFSA